MASMIRRPSVVISVAPSPRSISIIGPAVACWVNGCQIGETSVAEDGIEIAKVEVFGKGGGKRCRIECGQHW